MSSAKLKRRLALSAAVTALTLGAAGAMGGAAAQDAATITAAGSESAAAGGAAAVGRITVRTTRTDTDAFTFPGAITVIDREDILDLQPQAISDLFFGVPGVQFQGGPRRTGEVPSMRGISGEGVLILFDGVRQTFLSGHDGRFFVDPDLLRAVEVVRGPFSALYGSGALGGVLAFETLDAADLLTGGETAGYQLKTGYQSVNDEFNAGATFFGTALDGRFDALASLTYRTGGDIALADGTDLTADDDILSGLLKGSYDITEDLEASFSWASFRNDAREPNNGQGLNTGDLVDKDIRSDTYRAGLTFNPASNLVDAEVIGFLNETSVDEAEVDSPRVIGREVETIGFTANNRSTFDLSPNAGVSFVYGGEWYRDEQVGFDNQSADGTRGGVPDAEAVTYGVFLQTELAVRGSFGELNVIPAIRFDSFTNESVDGTLEAEDDAFSPKIGVSWQPAPWATIFANWAEAFRAPSYNEIFADGIHFQIPLGPFTTAPNFFVPNTDLGPEESETWEFGAGVDFEGIFTSDDVFTAKGSYFTSDVEDLIDLEVNFAFSPSCFSPVIPGPCTSGTSRNVNRANAELDGWDLQASYRNDIFYADLAFSAIDGTDTDTGEFLGVLTPNTFFADTGIYLPSIDGRLGTRFEVASEFDEVNDPSEIRVAYTVIDVYFAWTPDGPLEGLRLDLGLDNVGDVEYERVFAGVTQPGLNAKAELRWTAAF